MIKKKTLKFLIKAGISVSLLVIILTNIDWETALKNISSANLTLLFWALVLNLVERAELTYKWNLLIRIRGIIVSFGRLFLINSIGGFLGMFLPSSLGTDVVRGFYLAKNNSEKSVSFSSIFVDRVLGMFSLLLLCLISIFFAGEIISQFDFQVYIIIISAAVIILFYFFQKKETAFFLQKIIKKVKHQKILEKGLKLHASILEYKKFPKTLLFTFIITLFVQITRILTYYLVALAFGVSVPFVYFILFIPIIMLVIMIPISIGGLGVREGTFVAFFTLAGMSMNDAIIISFISSFIDTINTVLLGGGGYLFYNSPAKKRMISEVNKNSVISE
jgi:glycosyltransferase 2 family protein